MPLPSERLAAATRGAVTGAIFRLIAVWLGLGLLDLAGTAVRWLIVTVTDPGDGSGPASLLVRSYRTDRGDGDAWALYFLATTSVLLVMEVAALLWALRPERSASPALLFGIGLAGLVARFLAAGASALIPVALGRQGVEAIAAYSIAANLAGMLHMLLQWIFAATVLIVLFTRVLRQLRLDEREGPYREAAA